MDVLHAYALLREACRSLDSIGDYAVAAYVGHGMALLEGKYGIDPDATTGDDASRPAQVAKPQTGNNGWT